MSRDITLAEAAWAHEPGSRGQRARKVALAILIGLLGFLFDEPISVLEQPIRVSFTFGLVLPLLVGMAWGGRYALIAATVGLGAQGCWWIWPENGWANVPGSLLYVLWMVWQGWAARRRSSRPPSWWLDPYVVQSLFTIVFAIGMLTAFNWAFLLNPAPWAADSHTSIPLPVVVLITIKSTINFFLMVLVADALLYLGWVRRSLGLPRLVSGASDSLVISGAIAAAAVFWLLDAGVVHLLTQSDSPGWWQEVRHPANDRLISRLMAVVLCLAGGVVVVRLTRRRIRMAEALRASEENLRITLDSIGDAVISTDAGGRVVRLNGVAERLTGWSLGEAAGRPLIEVFRIINAITRKPCDDPVAKVLSSGQVVGLANHTVLLARGGHEYQIADSGAPIRTATGRIVGVVLVFRDVTTEYALQQQLIQAHKLDALGQLAGGVAHDFNNMLSGILGAAELLERCGGDEVERRHLLGVIGTAAQRASGLTRKLLAFARKGTGLHMPMRVHKAVAEAVEILQHSIDKRVEVRQDLRAGRDLVEGDLAELQSALLNLGINASHAMPEGGRLEFASREAIPPVAVAQAFGLAAEPHLEIRVSDTGCGIAADVLPHIFDPFFTTKAVGQGTGLGLTATYGTIRYHRGAITVESEPGRGTVIIIHLPLLPAGTPAPVEVIAPPAPVHPSNPASRGRILIVDDEELVRNIAAQMLGDLGYEVEVAGDGAAALGLFVPGRFVAVVLDMTMPVMDGRTCCQRLYALDPSVRVVLCSGYSHEGGDPVLHALGVHAVLRKPYLRAELAAALATALAPASGA